MLHALLLAALPVITVHPDDAMDPRLPTAPIAQWTDAQGRKRVTLRAPGVTLRGYSYAGGNAKAPVLVMFGGSGNLIERHDRAARGFAQSASRVVWYDYRGYGYSPGTAHFALLQADALRIFDAVAASAGGPQRVVVLGYSMGTAVADYVARNRHVRGLILAAPWDDYAAASRLYDPKHDFRLDPQATAALDETAMLKTIGAPLLVFQGTRDDQIPPIQGPRLERSAASPDKRFVPVAGAKHNGLLENPVSQLAVRRFLQHLTP